MIFQAFTIYDIKTEKHSMPMFVENENDAKRSVIAAAKGNNSMLSMFPGDYMLYYIGEWDNTDGKFMPTDPEKVCSIVDLIGVRVNDEI